MVAILLYQGLLYQGLPWREVTVTVNNNQAEPASLYYCQPGMREVQTADNTMFAGQHKHSHRCQPVHTGPTAKHTAVTCTACSCIQTQHPDPDRAYLQPPCEQQHLAADL